MLQNIMTAFGLKKDGSTTGGSEITSRRAYPRRSSDQCIGMVNGKAHPVLDWSPGGLRIFADPRPIAVGEEMDIEMKFHLRDKMIQVNHRAVAVRKGAECVSFQFLPLNSETRKTFQYVIDDFNVSEFAESQA